MISNSIGWAVLTGAVLAASAAHADDLRVGDIVAADGEARSGAISYAVGDDPAQMIPITIINGAAEGPMLSLVAGVHGSEYAPMLALQEVRRRIDPQALAGALVLVHLANPESFYGRTVYYHPTDGKNLNRQFPGDAKGSATARIADLLTREIIAQSDYFIDMHAGDGNERLAPYIYMLATGDEALDAKTRRMAEAFGIETILRLDVRDADPDNPVYTDVTAAVLGIPAMTTETGGRGETRAEEIDLAVQGVVNVMRSLAMIEGRTAASRVERWLEGFEVLPAPETGMVRARVDAGEMVREGDLLAEIIDLYGDRRAVVSAPFDGWVNYIVATPPITEGEPVAMVSRIGERPD